MVSPRPLIPLRAWRFSPDDRAVLRVQLSIVLALSVLLTVGFSLQREVRAQAQLHHVQVFFRGWDGFAWIVWPLASPAMLLLIRRFPLVRGHIRKNAIRLALSSVLLYVVVTNLRFPLRIFPNVWLPPEADLPLGWNNYLASLLVTMPLDLITYCGFFSASLAVDYYFTNRRRTEEALQLKLRTATLESALAQAELKALREQLHPHFLFNSFNAVTMLVRQGRSDTAVEVIAQLSGLLRLAMERAGRHELSLHDEIDFTRRYLEVERIRFGEKLVLRFEVAADALETAVPNLLLQPLVENAVKHGISRRISPGVLRVSAKVRADRLEIEVDNDGPESPAKTTAETGTARRSGIGVTNTRARLEQIYGTDFRFELLPRAEGGMHVHLDLPRRPMPAPLSL